MRLLQAGNSASTQESEIVGEGRFNRKKIAYIAATSSETLPLLSSQIKRSAISPHMGSLNTLHSKDLSEDFK